MDDNTLPRWAGNDSLWRFDTPLHPDDVPFLHTARLLILIRIVTGQPGRQLRGRTKLAKLDFFVRYPRFLEAALSVLRARGDTGVEYAAGDEGVEASMVRYRFGPWDHGYYDLLGILVARGLIRVSGAVESYSLTPSGSEVVDRLMAEPAFDEIVNRCRIVADSLGAMPGSALKQFVYDTFTTEVALLPGGREIPDLPRGDR
jgi:hypothetical protein